MQPPNQFNNSTPQQINNAIMDIGNYSANPPVIPYFAYTTYNSTTQVSVVNNYKATATGPILVTSQNVVTYDEIPRVGTLDLSSNYRSSSQYSQAVALGYKSSLTLSETVQCINYIDKTFQDISGDNGRRAQMLKAIFTSSNSLPDDQKPNTAKIVALYTNAKVKYPNMTDIQFNNWFMGNSEGTDDIYNPVFWEDPNLQIAHQNLPSLAAFNAAFPKNSNGLTYMTGADLYPLVGGAVYQAYLDLPSVVRGARALKVSRALNYSGIIIPEYIDGNGKKQTIKGADGKYYFVNAKALNAWLKLTFGTKTGTGNIPNNPNHRHFTATEGGKDGINFPGLISGMQGIFSMVSRAEIVKEWGSGHADLLLNGDCVFSCHFYDIANKFVPVNYIDIWILN